MLPATNPLGAGGRRRHALDSGDTGRFTTTSPVEVQLAAVATVGTLGPIILGVVCVSSEYTPTTRDAGSGRQILVPSPARRDGWC
jgi:hypothetical protein